MVRAVLFDLDDTLFDHAACARTALTRLHEAHACFRSHSFDRLEQLHAACLEELHPRVLTGELGIDAARRERFRRLFEAAGVMPAPDLVAAAAARYREEYLKVRRPIAGAADLLRLVRARARVAIVSNNLLEEQSGKLRYCGLDAHVDVLVVSEEAGVSKPDPAIFAIALQRLGCGAGDAVMVGDSWFADIAGARAAGLRAVWFNPRRRPAPEPAHGVAELHALEPADAALAAIFGGSPGSSTPRPQRAHHAS